MVARSRGAAGLEDWQRASTLGPLCMSRSRSSDDTVLIKEWPPTNYIISDILRCHRTIRAIFLYSDIEEYLNAIFRRHLAPRVTRRRTVVEFVETDLWPTVDEGKESFSDSKSLRHIGFFSSRRFFASIRPCYRPFVLCITGSSQPPVETVAAVARHFGIDVRPEETAEAFASVSERHSKSREKPYSMGDRQKEVELVAENYRAEIAEGVAQAKMWREAYPIPERLPCRL